ncbi:putative xylosidase/arabinosidase [Aspergillus foveolatus]|uniref:putative xylosidase/arabinosidase n=1 Tax=Aspergillus foveolatus TaxID=210207 RepID=UPI003CCCF9A2
MSLTYENPILQGFYPDPSIVRVNDTFYLIASSFQFFPGLPIHTSKDLVNWELVGNAINRPSQLSLQHATTKANNLERREIFTGGLYAPTMRFHNGTFYIVCTNLAGSASMAPEVDFTPNTNFLITCNDLANPASYSDPLPFEFHGIDPDLFFDDDGKVYMTGSFIHGYRKKPQTVIRQAEIDLATGKLITTPMDVWAGTGGNCPEGPHIYKKDGWYYLMIAEGGTHRRHKVTMARSRAVTGPFEGYQNNPLITGVPGSPITCVGHADLVQDTTGNWWAVMLGRRELSESGDSYPLGRETYMVPVEWPEGEFPNFQPVQLQHTVPATRSIVGAKQSESGLESQVQLSSPHTIYIRDPLLENYSSGSTAITLRSTDTELGAMSGSPTFVGRRQTSLVSTVNAQIELASALKQGHAGLVVYKDPFRYAGIDVDLIACQVSFIFRHATQEHTTSGSTSVEGAAALNLIIRSSNETYIFLYSALVGNKWSSEVELATFPCSDMSGDDFTGTVFGIYAWGCNGVVKFNSFTINSD